MREAGAGLIIASWVATAIHLVATLLGVLSVDRFGVLTATVAMALFLVGCAVFLAAFGFAVGRSRRELIGIGGLYFLAGSGPASVRTKLLGATVAQLVIGVGGAAARPFTVTAFAVLAPMLGLGMTGLWGSRHGVFPARPRRR